MFIPKFDNRDFLAFMNDIKNFAANYTPEWNFDTKSDDFGIVFSKIFAKMMEDTTIRFNQSAYNYYLMFLNILGLKIKPATPSTGIITATTNLKTGGAHIPKNTKVFANAETNDGMVIFETVDDLTVINSSISSIFFTNNKLNIINKVFEFNEEDQNIDDYKIPKFRIFDNITYENLQTHEIYFSNDTIFNMKKFYLEIRFFNKFSNKIQKNLPNILSDADNVRWQYFKDKNWHDINNISKIENGIVLKFENEQSKFCFDNLENSSKEPKYYIRAKFKNNPENFFITSVQFNSKSDILKADQFSNEKETLPKENFYPFGEEYNIFDNFYISCDEAFSKVDSVITINFDIKFVKIKTNRENPALNLKYRSLMTEADFAEIEPSSITIENVIWEFWNGEGWQKLEIINKDSKNLFKTLDINQNIKILKFKCPQNFKKISITTGEKFYIRARITKINNKDDFYADYISPLIKNVSINYDYSKTKILCNEIITKSNLLTEKISLDNSAKPLLKNHLNDYPSMYFCFTNPLPEGTIRMLFEIESGIFETGHNLIWEYLAYENSEKTTWKHIDILDLTENFIHSGTITLLGKNDFAESKIFGKKGFWIRITNPDKNYSNIENTIKRPVISDIKMNVVNIMQRYKREPEFFLIRQNEENKRCKLAFSGILDAEVWVDEARKITQNEQKNFLENYPNEVEAIYDDFGNVIKFWIKWNQTDNIYAAGMNDRVYEIDYFNSEILFGDGKNGKIPPSQLSESIRINYSTCNGNVGNIESKKIQNFITNITDVQKVTNPAPIYGGLDMENMDQASNRIFSKICGMNRMVTITDFENGIISHNRNICKIKCLANIDRFDNPTMGRISIGILPYDFMKGYDKFAFIANDVRNYINKNASANITFDNNNLDIFEVFYVKTSIILDVIINDFNDYQNVHTGILTKLKEFLNPVTGNFSHNGFEIGKFPDKMLIYNYIKNVKNIKWIRNINMFTSIITDEGTKEIAQENLTNKNFIIPIFDEPQINISIS